MDDTLQSNVSDTKYPYTIMGIKNLIIKTLHYNKTRFISSAKDISHLPTNSGIEIAFTGRSNTGKSSALNTLTNKQGLARTSKIPGRTQLINLFEVTDGKRLVDLPGYGFAAVKKEIKNNWRFVLNDYLNKRNCLKGLVVVMDIRHPLKDSDKQMINWAVSVNIPMFLLLNKEDKLATSVAKAQLHKVRKAVLPFRGDMQVENFSSLKKVGIDKLSKKLDGWFNGWV